MRFIYKAVTAVSLITLSGCVVLEQISADMQKASARLGQQPVSSEDRQVSPLRLIDQSAAQVCKAAEENRVRANSLYGGKGLSLVAQVRSVNEGLRPRYRVYLVSDNIHVHAKSDDLRAVSALSAGNKVRVTGAVGDLKYDFQGCSISLENARFQ